MSSRAGDKRRAHEERLVAEASENARERRRRSIALLVGSLLIAAIVVGGLILVSQSSDDGDPNAPASGALEGIPENGIALGDPNAPVTIVEFADPQCPFCAEYSNDVLPGLVDRYVRSGDVRMELRLLTFIGDDSMKLASAAYSAADQDGLWEFMELDYARQGTENTGYATDDFIDSLADDAGLDSEKVRSGATSSKVTSLLTDANDLAQKEHVDSTPSFLIGPTGGTPEPLDPSSLDVDSFTGPIDDALSAAGGS
jgi:protein-disulfide isomerase